jgi:thiol-disulfide isomerase/thioredoxin
MKRVSRRSLLGVLSGTFACTAPHFASSQQGPPFLSTSHSQFVEIRPLREAPPLALERIDGKRLRLDSFRGRPALVNFWATWCPPCRRELPLLVELRRHTPANMLEIIAVSIDAAPRPTIDAYLRRYGVTELDVFVDPAGRIGRHVGSTSPTPFVLWGMPVTYVLDRYGRVAGYITGEADWLSQQGRAFLDYFARG